METKFVPAGAILFRPGQVDDSIYVVRNGKLKVYIIEQVRRGEKERGKRGGGGGREGGMDGRMDGRTDGWTDIGIWYILYLLFCYLLIGWQ